MDIHMPESDIDNHTQNIKSGSHSNKCSYKSPLFGGYLLTSAPCYSSCGSYIFVSNSSRVHVYNSRDISYKFVLPITNSIVKISIYCSSHDYLLVLSKFGRLIIYRMDENYSNFDKFAEYSFTDLEMLDMKISNYGTIFFLTRDKSNIIGICILQLNLISPNSEIIECKDQLQYICKFDSDISCFALSYTGELIAVSISRLLLVFKVDGIGVIHRNKSTNLNNLEMYCTLSIHQITTLSFHPRENYLASGDITGKVITWHIKQFNDNKIDKSNIISIPYESMLSERMNNDFCSKKMGSIHNVNPNSIISPQIIAKLLVTTEDSTKSHIKCKPEINEIAVNSEIHFGNFVGLLEFDTRVLHWHAHAVNSLVFTNCGRFMLTGGEEAVVVIWDLENDTKRFITRLGSTIFNIVISTVDNIPTQYLVSCGNNCIKTFDPILLLLKHTIYGIQVPISMSIANFEDCKSSEIHDQFTLINTDNVLSVRPMKRNIYFQSLPINLDNLIPYGLIAVSLSGIRLQFFSLITGFQHSFLDFIDSNYVSRSQEDFGFTYLVEEICISNDCTKIIASSFRNIYQTPNYGDSVNLEKRILRFWHKNHDEFTYTLNTQINNVHFSRVINIIEFSDKFVSISFKDWKVWSFNMDFGKWNCNFTGSFKGFNNYIACLSIDKSLMVLSHGGHLSFWSTDDQSLLLHKRLSTDVINHICYVDQQYLLTATDFNISIWNIFSDSADPIHTFTYKDYKITQLIYKEILSNMFILILGKEMNTKFEVYQINKHNYSFKSIHVEEQSIPNGFITCCLTKVPTFAINNVDNPLSVNFNVMINGIPIDYIIKSSDYTILLIVLLNNLEFRTYVIDTDILTITPCEYLIPVITDTKIEKRQSYDSVIDRPLYMGQPIKRPTIIRPFDEDCPTFALPSPSVVFYRMARTLLKSNNMSGNKNNLYNNGI